MKISYLEYNGFEWDLGNLTKIKSRISISEIENFFSARAFNQGRLETLAGRRKVFSNWLRKNF